MPDLEISREAAGLRSSTDTAEHARDEARWRHIEQVADLLDARMRIPGTSWRFGLDAVIGLVPGVGDAASAAIALWLLWGGYRLGASKWTLMQMAGNIGVDALVGSVPVIGDAFDVAFKCNKRNVALLRRHLGRSPDAGRS